jgi:hypothetical protein
MTTKKTNLLLIKKYRIKVNFSYQIATYFTYLFYLDFFLISVFLNKSKAIKLQFDDQTRKVENVHYFNPL